MERIGEVLAYEISQQLDYELKSIITPLGEKECELMSEEPVLITILRAGVPFFNGFYNVFDKADAGFIGAYRGEYNDGIKENGVPAQIHIAAIIASEVGLNYLQQKLPENVMYWIGDTDKELNHNSYIVPGLGDAGDLCYGKKI